MRKVLIVAVTLLLTACSVRAQSSASRVIAVKSPNSVQPLDGSLFSAPSGWSLELKLDPGQLSPDKPLLVFAAKDGKELLRASVTGEAHNRTLAFALRTTFDPQPLAIGIPLALLPDHNRNLLLRYRGYSFELYANGVLIDEEWPIGKVAVGDAPTLAAGPPLRTISIWNHPLDDSEIISAGGGAARMAAALLQMLGPEPKYLQYSR